MTTPPVYPQTLTSSSPLAKTQARLQPLRQRLLAHPLYDSINTLPALQVFMQHHVFPVWDFMLLLKSLQQRLCPADAPWLPPENPTACRLINEIVLGEESDEDGHGGYSSHFELYRQAMIQAGADTSCVDSFIACLKDGAPIASALNSAKASSAVKDFVHQTCEIISSGDLCAIASAFTFGREDLLPDIFQNIVDELNFDSAGKLDKFRYYLARHIELDADQHGPMAQRLIETLCGDDADRWNAVETAATKSLQARIALWDAMVVAIGNLPR